MSLMPSFGSQGSCHEPHLYFFPVHEDANRGGEKTTFTLIYSFTGGIDKLNKQTNEQSISTKFILP